MGFRRYHPIVLLLYFSSVLFIVMFTLNPIILGMALFTSILLLVNIKDRQRFWLYLVFFLLIAFSNPLFSQNGETIILKTDLFFVTAESLAYGFAIATMAVAMMFWFKILTHYLTSDKLLYIFKSVPSIALTLSMGLKYIPILITQSNRITQAQTGMGYIHQKTWFQRVRARMRIYTALLSWSLENGIDTADSMKARGYGLKGKTSYSIFRFTKADFFLLCIIFLLFGLTLFTLIMKYTDFQYYPTFTDLNFTAIALIGYGSCGALFLLPFGIEAKENILWHWSHSKI